MKTARLLLTTLVTAGLLGLVPGGASGAAAAPSVAELRATTRDDRAMAREAFSLTGRLPTGFARTVRLQYRTGSRWVTVTSQRTGSGGRFTFRGVRTSTGRTYQVVAPSVRRGSKRYVWTRTPRRTVTVVAQRAAVALLPQIVQGSAVPASASRARTGGYATFSPVRLGRVVVVERRVGSRWTKVATGAENADGVAEFSFPGAAGTRPYRARALTFRGASGKTSGSTRTSWERPGFDEPFTDATQVDGGSDARWHTRGTAPSASSHRMCSRADASMASVDPGSGTLALSAAVDRTPPCPWQNVDIGTSGTAAHSYLNGHVGTQGRFSFRYGVAAARVRFQRPQGMHGSFWLQVAEPGGRSEIDAVEFFGEGYKGRAQGGLGTFVHADRRYGRLQPRVLPWLRDGDSWWSRYHVFSVEWTPTRYVFRVDGRAIWSTTEGLSDRSEFLVLSLLTSDYEMASMPDPELATRPSMSVDWVRVWQDRRVAGNRLTTGR